ncbi:PHD finger protein ALFIN-LIKE 1 [Cardamine amara subsp. amara]|uniref:PHD finger protein ALFIN-LIKE n=1 Tax=Cardamine amara subsp. amara TaxID=228776 RepID=A0ABD0ZEL5_CARAN
MKTKKTSMEIHFMEAVEETTQTMSFWICRDVCERWYHGKCVTITPTKAESIKQYKCPSCCSTKGRQ